MYAADNNDVPGPRLPFPAIKGWDEYAQMRRVGTKGDGIGREGLGLNATSDRGTESTPQLDWFRERLHTRTYCYLRPPLAPRTCLLTSYENKDTTWRSVLSWR